jgi:hypothetical protein
MRKLWWVPVGVVVLLVAALVLLWPESDTDGPSAGHQQAISQTGDAPAWDAAQTTRADGPEARSDDAASNAHTDDAPVPEAGEGRYQIVVSFKVPQLERGMRANIEHYVSAYHDTTGYLEFSSHDWAPMAPHAMDTRPPTDGWRVHSDVYLDGASLRLRISDEDNTRETVNIRLVERILHIDVVWRISKDVVFAVGRYVHVSGEKLENQRLYFGIPGHGMVETRSGENGRILLELSGAASPGEDWWFGRGLSGWVPLADDRTSIPSPELKGNFYDLGDLVFEGPLLRFESALPESVSYPRIAGSVSSGQWSDLMVDGPLPMLVPVAAGRVTFHLSVLEQSGPRTFSRERVKVTYVRDTLSLTDGERRTVKIELPQARTVSIHVQAADGTPVTRGNLHVSSRIFGDKDLNGIEFPHSLDLGRDLGTVTVVVFVPGWKETEVSFPADSREVVINLEQRTHPPDAPALEIEHRLADTPYYEHRLYTLTLPGEHAGEDVQHMSVSRSRDMLLVPEPGTWTLWVYGGARFGIWGGLLAGGIEVQIAPGTNLISLPSPPEPRVSEMDMAPLVSLRCNGDSLSYGRLSYRRADGAVLRFYLRHRHPFLPVAVIDGDRDIPLVLDEPYDRLRGELPARVRVIADSEADNSRFEAELSTGESFPTRTAAPVREGVAALWLPPGPAVLTVTDRHSGRVQTWDLEIRHDHVHEIRLERTDKHTTVEFRVGWRPDVPESERLVDVEWIVARVDNPLQQYRLPFDFTFDGPDYSRDLRLSPGVYKATCVAPGNLRGETLFEVGNDDSQRVELVISSIEPTGTVVMRLPDELNEDGREFTDAIPIVFPLQRTENVQTFKHTRATIDKFSWRLVEDYIEISGVRADTDVAVSWVGFDLKSYTEVVRVEAGQTTTVTPRWTKVRKLSRDWLFGMAVYWRDQAGTYTVLRHVAPESDEGYLPLGEVRVVVTRDGNRHEFAIDVPDEFGRFEMPAEVRAALGLDD